MKTAAGFLPAPRFSAWRAGCFIRFACILSACVTASFAAHAAPGGALKIPLDSPVPVYGDVEHLTALPGGGVSWTAPVGDRALIAFEMPRGTGVDDYGLLKVDVTIGGGPVDIMIFDDRPGRKRRMWRPVDVFDPPAGRQTIHVDLRTPEIVRQSHHPAGRPRIAMQLWAMDTGYPDQEAFRSITIENLRLVPRRLDVRWDGVEYESSRTPDGALVFSYPLTVVNRDSEPRTITGRLDALSGGVGSGVLSPGSTRIAPGDSVLFTANLRLPGDTVKSAPPFHCEWFRPVFSCAGVADSDEGVLRSSDRIALPLIVMPDHHPPVSLGGPAGFAAMLRRYRETDKGVRAGDAVIERAGRIIEGDPAIPDGPGWARAYYYCHEHRCVLRYEGEDRHFCPVGGEYRDVDFEGVDLDRDYRAGEHNTAAANAKTLAMAFALTGDRRFADASITILRQYRDRYFTWDWMDLDTSTETIDKGRLHFAKYMETYAFRSMIEALDILGASGGIDESGHRDIARNLLLPALVEITDYRMGVLCRQTTISTTALIGGLVLDHAPLTAFAVESPFGYFSLRRRGGTADGIGHGHGYAQSSYSLHLAEMAEYLHHGGLDTFDHELKRIVDATVWWNIPMRPERYAPLLTIASRHWPDPLYRRHARYTLEEGEPPPSFTEAPDLSQPLTVNFPHSGVTILRRPAPEGGTIDAEFKWGMPDNRGEFSVLSLGIDCYGYRAQSYPGHFHWGSTDLHHEWQIQAASHTTIVVDTENHSGMTDYFKGHYMPHPSEQIHFSEGPHAAATVAYNDRIHPGVRIWRAVGVLDGACLVIDVLRSEEEHTYDWWFHGVPDHSNGRGGIGLALSPRPEPLGDGNGYEMVEELSSAVTSGDVTCDWTVPADGGRPESRLTLRLENAEPVEVVHGFEWSRQYATPEKEFVTLRRDNASNADFIVLVEPHKGAPRTTAFERAPVRGKNGLPDEDIIGISLVLGGEEYAVVFNPLEKLWTGPEDTAVREVFSISRR